MRGSRAGPAIAAVLMSACASTTLPPPQPSGRAAEPGRAASVALERAALSYVDGRYGQAIADSQRALDQGGTPAQQRRAIRLIGIAGCKQKKRRPVHFARDKLRLPDREALKNVCQRSGFPVL